MEFFKQVISFLESFLNYSFFSLSLKRLALSLLVFLIIYFLRQLFGKLGVKIIKNFTSKTKTTLDDKLVEAIEPPIRFLFIIIGLWVSLEILKLPAEAKVNVDHLIRSLVVIDFIWAGYRASSIISQFIKGVSVKTAGLLDEQLALFVSKFLRVGIVAIGLIILVREWGYDITSLAAGLGLGGLAFALAARDTVANLFGSITILIDKPFLIGDWIQTSQLEGTVENIGLRSTRVRTFANALVSIPNSVLANESITNWSRMGKRRITFKLGVTYSSTRTQMQEATGKIKEMLKKHPEVHPETILTYFTDFGESALEIFIYFFTKTTVWEEYLKVRQDINLKIMEILEQMGMQVAFPSRSLYLENINNEFQKRIIANDK